jgi:hypothetical protein
MPLRAFDSRYYNPFNELPECSVLPEGVLQQLGRLLYVSESPDRASLQEELYLRMELPLRVRSVLPSEAFAEASQILTQPGL